MNSVKIDLDNDCPEQWVPSIAAMETWLDTASRHLSAADKPQSLSVRVIGEQDSAQLNSQYRGRDKPTNVLSFTCQLPAAVVENLDCVPLGDLAICAPLVESEADQQGKTRESHWAHLLTHGYLHLNGFVHDTPEQAESMEALEISVLEELGFPNPYLLN